jgi:hypothetical protein
VFRQLEPHRHVADLRLESTHLPFLGIEAAAFEPLLPAPQKHAAPLFDLVDRHLDLPSDLIDRFASHDS